MRSTGAKSSASIPPCSRSTANRRVTPITAASSRVTHSTPEAREPSIESRWSPKWKSTNTVSEKSVMAGTDSLARSSSRRSLRRMAAVARSTGSSQA